MGGNIRMDIQKLGCWGMEWIELAQVGTSGGHL